MYRFKTEEEFREEGLWEDWDGNGRPKGWVPEMNKYLGTIIDESLISSGAIGGYFEYRDDDGAWSIEYHDYVKVYECLPIVEGAVKLRVIKKPHWVNEPYCRDRIPDSLRVGSITWCNGEDHEVYHIEDNKYGVNFDKSCFEVINEVNNTYPIVDNPTHIIRIDVSDEPAPCYFKGDIVYGRYYKDDFYFNDKDGDETFLYKNHVTIIREIPNPIKEETKSIKEEENGKTSNEVCNTIMQDSGNERQGCIIIQSGKSRVNITGYDLSNERVIIRRSKKLRISKGDIPF